ncbi:MAG: methyl-accepting chemotaxis protein, partial [Polaromonas sp.]|nr:methyl-accepting chemotaxis protein [Polaromonas sp.]
MAFASVLALLVALSALAWFSLEASKQAMQGAAVMAQRSAVTDEWVANTRLNATRVTALAKSNNHTALDSFFTPQIAATTAHISGLQKRLDEEITSEKGRALLAEVGQRRKTYVDTRNNFFKTLLGGDDFQADRMLEAELLPSIDRYLESMGQLQQFQVDLMKEAQEASDAAILRQEMLIGGLTVVALLLAAVVGWRITRSITEPLKEAVSVATAVAAGDLTQRVETNRKDELGDLLNALGAMKASLVSTVGQVRSATDSINTASMEIASGNQDLSARTEQAASNLEETAASMEQLTSTVRQSADAARQANQLASSAAEIAARGGQVVGQVVTTMDEINHSSKKISDIIGVIDGIAFQTNILALNAAVEAARAGEQGRGFAVVAGEVRNLAQRSAEAAKEIKNLIGASVDRVEAGSRLVADAGQTMSEIVGSVQRVSDIIGEITAAAGEQSDGIGQVNVAVTQL